MTSLPLPLRTLALGLALAAPLVANATNGYFSHGYGAKSQGMAGVGIALPQDGLAAATNPAGTALVGNRYDFGLTVFAPKRSTDIIGNGFGADASYSGNDTSTFLIPDFGYTRQINPDLAVGVAVYGNGGMNTDYGQNPYARFGATGSAGVNLEQLFISPSVAYKVNDTHTFGAALNVAYQRFEAKGIGLFSGFSTSPANVSDQGVESSTGVGVRLGWIGKVTPQLTLGATWSSKISGKFDKYKGLFADGGSFDVPENYGLGLAFEATPAWTLAADVQTILYSKVSAVGNSAASLFAGQSQLGAANGPGFGWKDVTVLKLGVSHQLRSDLVLRGGLSFANQPVPQSETFFNILAPGVITRHVTLGATWTSPSGGELTGFFAHGLGETVNGSGSITPGNPPGFGGGEANVRLKENIIGIAYGWKF
ncbi:OmpP1/FadL family transporter [Rhodoferax sp. U11-2br]|uniref:OmpP1/FadL family transporter n=1 Tax=Rhodoferax sp. U11-2br TaxID=2838878 RepID=UPI001BE9BA12|nr:outer membrane protein transport protein [Rhodoferax sp. U11-2br]MBT3065609.1 outer membrane protein transport protein [Rhodoferax sp. U11-2br]